MSKVDQVENGQQHPQKLAVGRVISNKMDKTIVVQIERKVKHPLYGKYMKKFTKLYAHDEANACQIGDIVSITQTRPLSKSKCWKLTDILTKQQQ